MVLAFEISLVKSLIVFGPISFPSFQSLELSNLGNLSKLEPNSRDSLPPTNTLSAILAKFSITGSLVSTLAPPIIAIKGLCGFFKSLVNISNSLINLNPA